MNQVKSSSKSHQSDLDSTNEQLNDAELMAIAGGANDDIGEIVNTLPAEYVSGLKMRQLNMGLNMRLNDFLSGVLV